MISEDISNGEELVKVPVVNELSDERPTSFGYTRECIAGPNVDESFKSPFYPGCECRHCKRDTCPCLHRFGPCYDEEGCLQIFSKQPTVFCQPVFECNSCCICPASCTNRVVQKGQQLRLQVFKTKHKGWGLRPLEIIKKFAFVCEYAGELISVHEAKRRTLELTSETGNYLIALREHSYSSGILRTHVDARFHGNASRFINHSCNPNLVMVPVRVDSMVPRLALFAATNIDAGEELSFDYSGQFTIWSTGEPCVEYDGIEVLRGLGKEPKKCSCGSQNCSGFLPFDSSLYVS